ncbi:polysaccharide deacetylase family protein [Virgibacillus sp. YIM 98842]|uniref:polysaccharide deacetylase family protein n=1 Tax=Virgibacillus sp. YIM 98842 TaxID=2663533 RepID=UPI001F08E592|nr:polysaccharide deacetylase family protein [Virgibacillus sp. YIM 98842]
MLAGSLFLGLHPSSAQQENIPELEDGEEYEERIRNPVSNVILQQRFPDILVLSAAPTENTVALTFDDGPDPRFTPQILDLLAEHDIQATFFVTGARAEAYPELLQRIVNEGHVVGNHTYGHPNLVEASDMDTLETEVLRTEEIINSVVGYRPKLFRAPYGFLYDELLEKLGEMDYTVVGWSVDSLDWQEDPPEVIAYNVINNIHPGAIVLMHDGASESGDRTNTIEALRQIIPNLRDQGLEFETVPEMLDIPYQK